MAKILIVEDDKRTNMAICEYLKPTGHNIVSAYDGEEALQLFHSTTIDLIVLDIMLPRLTGIAVLHEIRKSSLIPVLMLTAIEDEYTQSQSFDELADDYVTKPFGIMELLSRIRSVLRRSGKSTDQKGELLSFGTIRADRNRHVVTVDEKEVAVTLKEFQLLCYLLLNKGIVLSREQIMQAVWDIPFEMESRTIDMHIMSLRQKLGGEGAAIRTIRGVGYRLGEREK